MTTATRDEVWEILKQMAVRAEETKQQIQAQMQAQMQAQRQAEEESKKKLDEGFRELWQSFKETDRKLALQSDITDRKIKEVSASIGRLGNRLGEFVEGLVKPAVVRLFQERGIEVHEVHRDVSAQRGGEGAQLDLLVVNDSTCVIVEVKSLLSVDDVNDHIERMSKFKRLFPTYVHKDAHGAVAAMVIPDDVARYAYRQGFFVIGQKGETVEILNDIQFKPQAW